MMNVMMIFAAGKRRRDLGRFVRHHVLPRVSNLSLFASNTEQHVKVQARVRFFAFCALLLAPTFTRNHRTQKKKVQRVARVSLQSFKRIDFGGQNTVRENPFATSFSSALCVARVACVLFVRKQRYGETRLSYSLLVSRDDALSSASFVCVRVCVFLRARVQREERVKSV